MKKQFIFVFILCCYCLGACDQQEKSLSQNQSDRTLAVDGHLVQTRALENTVSSTANLLPYEQVEIRAPIAGNVLGIYFEEGQEVQKGELLISIDDRQLRARKEGLEARLISAKKELARRKELLDIEGSSQEEVDQARATVSNLSAQIRELQVQINLANVNAPFSGEVGMRNFSLGSYLPQGQPITQLVQTQRLKVDFSLPAQYLSYIEEGQPVKVMSDDAQDTAQANIYAIDPLISAGSRSIQIRAVLENDSLQFVAGNFAEVEVSIELDEEAVVIPAEAVVPDLDAHVVYKVEEGLARRQSVSLGVRTDDHIQIEQGLAEGDTILLTGLMQVSDSTAVQIRELKEEAL